MELYYYQDGKAQLSEREKEFIYQNNLSILNWSINLTDSDLANPLSRIVLLYSENTLMGYCGWQEVLDEASINYIVIGQAFRSCGYGSALLEKSINCMHSTGIKFIHLEVRESNQSAICLYKKFGFKRILTRPNYYHQPLESGYIMQLKLL